MQCSLNRANVFLQSNEVEAFERLPVLQRQQLEQLYGPLLAAHKAILARGELRVELQRALVVKDTPAVTASVQDENQSFREVTMPRYREMVDTFRSKMWLAEPETREYLGQLIEFVDAWDKILRQAAAIDSTRYN
jgi:hypothetical protein